MIKYSIFLCLLVASILMPRLARADLYCNSTLTMYFNPTSSVVLFDNSKAIGAELGSVEGGVTSAPTNMSCSDPAWGNSGSGFYVPGFKGYGSYLGNYVYSSGIAGVGLKIYQSSAGCYYDYYPQQCPYKSWDTVAPGRYFKVTFVKTGNISGGGTLTGTLAQFTALSQSGTQTAVIDNVVWGAAVIVRPAVKPTCSVDNNSVQVPMGTVKNPQLSAGQTFNPVDFNLKLNCSGGDSITQVTAYLTLTDATVPGNRSTTLNLGVGSTASGFGIEILRNGMPVSFGPADGTTVGTLNQFNVDSTTGGSLVIPFTGRYVVTGKINAGLVKASAIFTVVYQ